MEKAIIDLVQQLRDEVIANYKNKRLIASGNFERETVVVDGDSSVQIVAPHYVYQMIQGRRGGSAPPVSVISFCSTNVVYSYLVPLFTAAANARSCVSLLIV